VVNEPLAIVAVLVEAGPNPQVVIGQTLGWKTPSQALDEALR
jgi:hypothetical protein